MNEQLSKEQIIDQYEPMSEYPSYYHISQIEQMMDKYAKESAAGFNKWCNNGYWFQNKNGLWFCDKLQLVDTHFFTTEQLFDSYIKSIV